MTKISDMGSSMFNRIIKISLILMLACPFTALCVAGDKENKMKVAYMYQFAKFVKWPATQMQLPNITLGVLGKNQLGAILENIHGKKAHRKPMTTRLVATLEEARVCCHILYISNSEEENIATILTALQGRAILTVSDIAGFAEKGGVIDFVRKGTKLKFEINLKQAKENRLQISSQLLKVGIVIVK